MQVSLSRAHFLFIVLYMFVFHILDFSLNFSQNSLIFSFSPIFIFFEPDKIRGMQNDILTNELFKAHLILPWDLLIGPILFQYLSLG